MSRRIDAKSFKSLVNVDFPKKVMAPDWQETSCIIDLIKVVLPDPLSPTIANVSPLNRLRETPLTAVISAGLLLIRRFFSAKGLRNFTIKFSICKIGP